MKTESGELKLSGAIKSPRKVWPLSRWLLFILLVLGAHLALIFAFGTRKPIRPQPVTNVPRLVLAGGQSEWLELNDPTLFALPNRQGFAGPAWIKPPPLHVHMPDWTEKPRLLELSNDAAKSVLGAVFSEFMRTNRFAGFRFELKPPAQLTVPVVPMEPAFPRSSTLRVEDALAHRRLLTSMNLPSWPYAGVLSPTVVQVLVNPSGEVVSAVLLKSSGYVSADPASITPDRLALDLARTAHFERSQDMTVGKLVFDWRTIAPPATNAIPGT